MNDEAVEQTGAARSFKGLEDCPPIQWGYQTATQHVDETGSRVGLGHTIVMLNGDVRLPDDLVRSEYFGAVILN